MVKLRKNFNFNPDYGNLILDRNKGITEVTYNHLNLPKKIVFENNDEMEYLYDANGTKLRKKVKTGAITRTTHYIDGFQYSEDKMDFFPTAEGYVNVTYSGTIGGGTASYNYVYNYTDHLGNIRLRYTKNPGTGGGLRILEEDHYYPFGLKHQGYNGEHSIFEPGLPSGDPVVIVLVTPLTGDKYKYKFNGMEWQNELDLNYYDFGMRNYDPALGRWMNIDPLAEVTWSKSPYLFAFNNPVYYIDPDGMMASGNVFSMGSELGSSFGNPSSTLGSGESGGSNCPSGDCFDGGELDEVVITTKRTKDGVRAEGIEESWGDGIFIWGHQSRDLVKNPRGTASASVDADELITTGSGRTFSNWIARLFQKLLGTQSRANKIQKTLEPNESSMENSNEEPIEPPSKEETISRTVPIKENNHRLDLRIIDTTNVQEYVTFQGEASKVNKQVDSTKQAQKERYEKNSQYFD